MKKLPKEKVKFLTRAKRFLRGIINILGFLVIVLGSMAFGYMCARVGTPILLPDTEVEQTVTEKLMDVQRDVGCTQIDAKVWGPESKGKLKPIVEAEEWQSFDQRAQKYMTESGAPE